MLERGIACLALQKAMLNMNNLPQGLFKSSFFQSHPDGKWGIVWVIHPAWQDRVKDAPNFLTSSNPNILWIEVLTNGGPLYLASVYLPNSNKSDNKMATLDTIQDLLCDLKALPCDAADWPRLSLGI